MSEKKSFNDLPEVTQHSISDFLFNEEASIPKGRLMAIGSLMVLLAFALVSEDALADHRSHSSHSSHRSHSSGSGGHSSHVSHTSHTSHSSGSGGHSNHSNHASHNSYTTYYNEPSRAAATPVPAQTPVPSSMLKTPQTLPDTLPIK